MMRVAAKYTDIMRILTYIMYVSHKVEADQTATKHAVAAGILK